MSRRITFKRRVRKPQRRRDNVGRLVSPQQAASSGWQGLPLPLNTDTPRLADKSLQTQYDLGGGGLQAGMR